MLSLTATTSKCLLHRVGFTFVRQKSLPPIFKFLVIVETLYSSRMDDNDEDRLSLSVSDDDDDDKDSLREHGDERKRSWHQSESRTTLVSGHHSDPESDDLSPSPVKRFKDNVSDDSDGSPNHDQEEGEIVSDDSSAEEGKMGESGDVATRDHSPPDSYNVTSEKDTMSEGTKVEVEEMQKDTTEQDKSEEIEDIEVSISQENQDDSLFDFGSKDTEEIKDTSQSPQNRDMSEPVTSARDKRYSSSSESSSSSSSAKDTEEPMDVDMQVKDDSEIGDAPIKRKEATDSEDSSSDSSDVSSPTTKKDTRRASRNDNVDTEKLFKQREHPASYPEEGVSSGDGLFKQRRMKERDEIDGKQVFDDSDDDYTDPVNIDHLEITVPQRTISKERKVKVHKRSEGSRSETNQAVEDISDENEEHDSVYVNDRLGKTGDSSMKSRQEQFRTIKSGGSASEPSRGLEKQNRMFEGKDYKRKDEGSRIGWQPLQEAEGTYTHSKKRSKGIEQTGKWRKEDRHGSEKEYEKRRGHYENDPSAERYRVREEFGDVKTSEKSRSKSSIQVKSQVHAYTEVGRSTESSEGDLRKKLLKKQEAKSYYDRNEQRIEQSKMQRGERKTEMKVDMKQQEVGNYGKEKIPKKYQKEHKLKKRTKHRDEKDAKRMKHSSTKVKVKKEHKKKKEMKSEEKWKRKGDKDKEDSYKGKPQSPQDDSSGQSESSSESDSHRSSDENEILNDDTAVDEDIQLKKTGSESGNEQGYDDISSAESDLSPVPSPVEFKKPPYFPATQGCRSVEEFQWLNRIEEGTYGVVYRARDRRTDDIVALKRLKMEKEREGFPITSLREINTLLKAQHPNIVTVREIVVGSNMDKIYIVMDYVAHDLKSLMEVMTQPFLVGEIKTLMIQLLRGVQHLHDNWILHRDIKTSNLLLSHNGILKIGDFGLAREYGSPLKLYTPIVVTLWYRAPELLLGMKEYSTAIDVWSVGCVFAELLMMKPLFPGKSEIDQLNRIFKELGTPNDKIWPGPPPFSELPMVKKTSFADHPYNVLRQRFGATLTDKGFTLLNRFLTYDPKKRITSEEALNHEYFKESPLPVDPSMFPTWPAKSEGHKVARKHNASPKPPEGGQYAQQMADDEPTLFGFHMPAPVKGVASKGPGFSLKF